MAKKKVKVPLKARGRRLVRGRKSVKVWANFKLAGVAAAAQPSTRIKLKPKS